MKLVQFSHVHVFFDSHNVQKSVKQIIYLWPLPTGMCHNSSHESWQPGLQMIFHDNLLYLS